MNKTLILTVGLPRSGKTTWAQNPNQFGCPIVSPDQIRYALHGERFISLAEPFVWAIAKVMVRALFLAGHNTVIIDATNGTVKRRAEWKSKNWDTSYIWIPTDASTCIARALALNDEYIVPVIERMSAEFEPVTPEEGITQL